MWELSIDQEKAIAGPPLDGSSAWLGREPGRSQAAVGAAHQLHVHNVWPRLASKLWALDMEPRSQGPYLKADANREELGDGPAEARRSVAAKKSMPEALPCISLAVLKP